MIETYNKYGGNVVAVKDVPREETSKYGILDIGEKKGDAVAINGLVEKPDPAEAPSTLSIIGRYILQPEIFSLLEETEPGHGGEIQLTDALLKLSIQRGMYAYEFDGTRFDAGDKLGYLKAIVAFGSRHQELGEEFRKYIKQVSEDF